MPEQKPYTSAQVAIARPLIRAMSAFNVWIYRASGGRAGGTWLRGAPICLVTTTGRKSGARRTTPLLYLRDGENVVVVASQGGMPNHPAWYHNIRAHPEVEVEIGGERSKRLARTARSEERAALWPRLTAMYPDYDDYQARTDREIPVVILEPR